MTYQPTPFSLIMPEVPAHMSDGQIAQLWYTTNVHNEKGLANIRSIQMDPFMTDHVRYNRVTIHFDDFENVLGHSGDAFREQIIRGEYTKYMATFNTGNNIIYRSYLLPCDTPDPPRTEYSHVVALQLQDVVRDQLQHISNLFGRDDNLSRRIELLDKCIKSLEKEHTKEIECLETRINKLEKRIQEETKLQLDINQSNIEEIDLLEPRIQSQEEYNHHLEERIIALEAKMASDAREKEILEYKMAAVIEWCSQPVWRRKFAAFAIPKAPEETFVSEF